MCRRKRRNPSQHDDVSWNQQIFTVDSPIYDEAAADVDSHTYTQAAAPDTFKPSQPQNEAYNKDVYVYRPNDP